MTELFDHRRQAIRHWLEGETITTICCSLKHSRTWFYKWQHRYQAGGCDALTDVSHQAHTVANKTQPDLEQAIVRIREEFAAHQTVHTRYSLIGAPTIRRELDLLGYQPLPPIRTIEEVLHRHGLTTPQLSFIPERRLKAYPGTRPTDSNQVHQLDLVGPRYLKGQSQRYYYNVVKDTFDCAVAVSCSLTKSSSAVLDAVVRAWQRLGIPKVLQLDNALEFRGSNRWPRSFSQLIRLALCCHVEVVFIPEGMPQWNGAVENFNGQLEELFLDTQQLRNFPHIRKQLQAFEHAANTQHIHKQLDYRTPREYRKQRGKRPQVLPHNFTLHQKKLPLVAGKVSFIRLVSRQGNITILNEKIFIGKRYKYDYVKATIFTKSELLKIYYHGKRIKVLPYKLRKP